MALWNPPSQRHFRFDAFEVDLRTGELRKSGIRLKIQEQPLKVLAMLLARPGELVTREELRNGLWSDGTFVDFEQGLNTAVNRLRGTLNDSAEEPRFVETVGKRGYRFVAPVTLQVVREPAVLLQLASRASESRQTSGLSKTSGVLNPAIGIGSDNAEGEPGAILLNQTSEQDTESIPANSKSSVATTALLLIVALLVIAIVLVFRFQRFGTSYKQYKQPLLQRQLTANPSTNSVIGALISPDGKQLIYNDRDNGLSLLQIDTGEKRTFPNAFSIQPTSWFPDGATVLLGGVGSGGAWKMSTLDGTTRKILDETVDFQSAVVSPDGSQIAFNPISNPSEIWIMGANGEEPHRILSVEPALTLALVWSPTSRRILFSQMKVEGAGLKEAALESCSRDGRECVTVVSDLRLQEQGDYEGGQDVQGGLWWSADGRVFYTLREPPPNGFYENIWSIAVNPDTGQVVGRPSQVTHWTGFCGSGFSQSADGKRFAFLSVQSPTIPNIAEVLSTGKLGPSRLLVDDNWDKFVTGWTSDSQSILFESNPQGHWGIFRQNVKTHDTEALLSGPDRYENPVGSPDGRWLLFTQYSTTHQESARLMRMSINGGSSTAVLEGEFSYDCASRANVCILSELTKDHRVFSILDPLKGRGPELAQVGLVHGNHSWSLSPDGQNIAFAPLYNGHNGNQIQILRLESGSKTHPLNLKNSNPEDLEVQSVAWAPDNQHLYVSAWTGSSFAISLVSLDGQVTKLVEMLGGQQYLYAPTPSPDGRYLAYLLRNYLVNVTMLENY